MIYIINDLYYWAFVAYKSDAWYFYKSIGFENYLYISIFLWILFILSWILLYIGMDKFTYRNALLYVKEIKKKELN